MPDDVLDCLIVGGGPAGLTAAVYLARFRMSALVVDAGKSRAATIPCTRNQAGFPDGIPGIELLARMRRHASSYGIEIRTGLVAAIRTDEGGFAASVEGRVLRSRTVLLATGVTNRRPGMPEELHDRALREGRLRYCPVCDGYEVTDQQVAVIGTSMHGLREAIFLRSYTRRVTLIAPEGPHDLGGDARHRLAALGIAAIDGPVHDYALAEDGLDLSSSAGRHRFQSVYPALGSVIHSDLAQALGASCSTEGCIGVTAHQQTDLPGLYAAGDVVLGLDQITHAVGEAAVAATAIRNDLAARRPMLR